MGSGVTEAAKRSALYTFVPMKLVGGGHSLPVMLEPRGDNDKQGG